MDSEAASIRNKVRLPGSHNYNSERLFVMRRMAASGSSLAILDRPFRPERGEKQYGTDLSSIGTTHMPSSHEGPLLAFCAFCRVGLSSVRNSAVPLPSQKKSSHTPWGRASDESSPEPTRHTEAAAAEPEGQRCTQKRSHRRAPPALPVI